jgi:hypothetical protein
MRLVPGLLLLFAQFGVPSDARAATTVDLALGEQHLTVYSRSFLDLFTTRTGLAVGDVNGDGIPDLALGGPSGGTGRASLVFGPLLAGTERDLVTDPADLVFVGASAMSQAGHALAIADVSGDGVADLVIGAPGEEDSAAVSRGAAGAVHVLFGPLSTGPDRILGVTSGGLSIRGADDGDELGFALSVADVSGDGSPDLIASAPGADGEMNARPGAGDVYVFLGPLAAGDVDLAVTPADAVIVGGGATSGDDQRFGGALATGDLSGDGLADVVIGAETADGTGALAVVFGPMVSGLVRDLDAVPGDVLVRGADVDDGLGTSVAVGDIVGDMRPDLVVGAPAADGPSNARRGAGEVHGFMGPLPAGSVLDLGAMSPDLLVLGKEGSILGDPSSDGLGSALAMGDLDGDGREDLVLGAPGSDGPLPELRPRAGSALVLRGPRARGSVVDLGSRLPDVAVHGAGEQHRAGSALAAGDFDGDGRRDLLLGSPQIFERLPSGGAAYGVILPTVADPTSSRATPPRRARTAISCSSTARGPSTPIRATRSPSRGASAAART